MFDQSSSTPQQAPRETLQVAVVWTLSDADLLASVKPLAAVEQFSVAGVSRDGAAEGVATLTLVHEGRQPDLDGQILSLLRRISARTRWLKVERLGLVAAAAGTEAIRVAHAAAPTRPAPSGAERSVRADKVDREAAEDAVLAAWEDLGRRAAPWRTV